MYDEPAVIREVDPSAAEAVLTVQLFVPGVARGTEEYHLARIPPPARVVESVTVNPDGSVTTASTYKAETLVIHCTHADGQKGGYRKDVFIQGLSADTVSVRISMTWTADGVRGNFDEEIVVPWLGSARVELLGGWVEARINRSRSCS